MRFVFQTQISEVHDHIKMINKDAEKYLSIVMEINQKK